MNRCHQQWVTVQKVIAVVLALAVQAAALTGPFVHAHLDNHATEHHDGRLIHAHWPDHTPSHRPSETPEITADDHDRAVALNAFVAVALPSLSAPVVMLAIFELPVPDEREAHRVGETVHSHDPPVFRSLFPRAPPAFPVLT